jgi:hypothetical protein
MFNGTVLEMGFVPTIADPDVYRWANVKTMGLRYNEYLLVYVDDVLIISHNPMKHLERIQSHYEFNPASVGPPNRYLLGADVRKVTRSGDPTGCEYCSFSSAGMYVKNAVKNVKLLLQVDGRNMKTTAKSPPFSSTTYLMSLLPIPS